MDLGDDARTARPMAWTLAAVAIIALGGWLRLHDLASMEFKADEEQSLRLAAEIGADPGTWPATGIMSSGGVFNAPLYTWFVAAFARIDSDPLSVAACVAALNTLCLFPLWRWALRRMEPGRALLMLAAVSVSPFAVIYSRKITQPDFLAPALLLVLWGVEWLRDGRTWRALIAFGGAVLIVGQVHQTGPIALAVLPVALAIQWLIDRRHRTRAWRLPPLTLGAAIGIVIVIALNVFFWAPYLDYLRTVPVEAFAEHVRTETMRPFLLGHVINQLNGSGLIAFFEWDRAAFLADPLRALLMRALAILGWPLIVYGLWRWLRAPGSMPVLGVWWALVIAAFMLARLTTHPYYTLILAPVPAVLAAGGFDPATLHPRIEKLLRVWRAAYVVALLVLTIVMQRWISERGGATPEYGITYAVRRDQARNIVALISGHQQDRFARGFAADPEPGPPFNCDAPPPEIPWLVRFVAPADIRIPDGLQICERWIQWPKGLKYEWQLELREVSASK